METEPGEDDLRVLNEIYRLLQDLDHERRARILSSLATLLNVSAPLVSSGVTRLPIVSSTNSARIPFSQDLSIGPKQFLIEKRPKTDVERIACLAYYLTHYRDTLHFKTIDLSKLNTEAAQPRLSNPTFSARNAVQQGYLAPATRGQKQLSAAGEQFVNALPDREAAREVMSSFMKRRKPRKSKAVED